MRTFKSAEDAHECIIDDILSQGEDDGIGNLEIINYAFVVEKLETVEFNNKVRKFKTEFAQKFFDFIMKGGTDASVLFKHNENVKKFNDDLADRNTAYGPRIIAQMPGVVNELVARPHTRRAVLTILHPDDQMLLPKKIEGSGMEYPCTVSLIFLLRNEKLNLHVAMRSNNMVTTINYDLFNFINLQKVVLEKLNSKGYKYKIGKYFHVCASAHILKEEIKFAKEISSEYKRSKNAL